VPLKSFGSGIRDLTSPQPVPLPHFRRRHLFVRSDKWMSRVKSVKSRGRGVDWCRVVW
jgi:hypothetical protein